MINLEEGEIMKYMPLVSVVMPAYNAEKYVGYAIESILNQTYSNIELIIVDDFSIDYTWEIIKSYKDKRIRTFRNKKNMGIANSTNRAIKEAMGEYIALMDDDDMAVNTRIKTSLDFMTSNPDIDLIGGSAVIIDEQNEMIGIGTIPRNNPNVINAMLLFKNWIYNGTVMFKKEIVLKNDIWYKEESMGMQDFRFFMEASKKTKFSSVPNVLLYYRRYSDNTTAYMTKQKTDQRAKTYADIQRKSIELSGFKLTEQEMMHINNMITETMRKSYSMEELNELCNIFKKMVRQAEKHSNIGEIELKWVCKKILADRLVRTDCI